MEVAEQSTPCCRGRSLRRRGRHHGDHFRLFSLCKGAGGEGGGRGGGPAGEGVRGRRARRIVVDDVAAGGAGEDGGRGRGEDGGGGEDRRGGTNELHHPHGLAGVVHSGRYWMCAQAVAKANAKEEVVRINT